MHLENMLTLCSNNHKVVHYVDFLKNINNLVLSEKNTNNNKKLQFYLVTSDDILYLSELVSLLNINIFLCATIICALLTCILIIF